MTGFFKWLDSLLFMALACQLAFPPAARASAPPPVLIESDNICRAAVLPVHALNIGARAKNSLKKHGIKTALQLIQMPPERLLNMPGIGKDSFARVAIALWKEGLYLGVQLAPGQKKAMQPPDLPPEQKLQSLSLPAESLNLSVRASRRLHQEGIHYIRDLVQITEEELLLIEGIGAGSVREIRQALTQKGLSLGMGLRLASPPRLQERESGPHAKPLEKAPAGASPANNKESEAAFRPPDFVYKGDAAASAPPGFSAEQMQFFSSSVKAGSLGLQRRAWKTLVLEGIQQCLGACRH